MKAIPNTGKQGPFLKAGREQKGDCTKGKRFTVYNNLTDERREDNLLLCIVKQDDKVYDREQ